MSTSSDYSVYREVIAQLMNGKEELPGLPSITLEIRSALTKSDVSLNTLATLVARDPSLSALLMKYASSGLLHGRQAPQTLFDVIRVLGMAQVERVTMLHSVKCLFTLHSAAHKRLFLEAWERLILKASICSVLAKALGRVAPDHALLASLLSEIGTFAVLSAFKTRESVPTRETYVTLCREYSKSLGIIMLKKWAVDDSYIQVVRKTGDWKNGAEEPFGLHDIINLGLFHSLKLRASSHNLPAINDLAAYKKLAAPFNFITATGELEAVVSRRADIRHIVESLH